MKKKERLRLRNQLRTPPPPPLETELIFPPISEAHRTEVLKAIRLDRPQLEIRIRAAIQRCEELFTQHDPIILLTTLASKWAFQSVDIRTNEVSEGGDAFLEYAVSIATSVPPQSLKQSPSKEVIEELEALIPSLHHDVSFFHGFDSAGEDDFTPEKQIKAKQMISSVYQRGHSLHEDQVKLLEGLFSPHSDFFRKHLDLSTNDLLDTAASLYNQPLEGMKAMQMAAQQMYQAVERLSQPDLLNSLPVAGTEEELAAKIRALPEIQQIIPDQSKLVSAVNRNPFELAVSSPGQHALLSVLSINFGENSEFRLPAHAPCWPLNSSAISLRPVVNAEGKYFAFAPQLIWRNLDKILTQYIRTTDPSYWEKFRTARGIWLEQETLRLISERTPGAKIYHSLFYDLSDDVEIKRMELDGVIVFDGHVLLLSAKSGQVTAPARRGSLPRMQTTYDQLVADGFDQLIKAREYILAHPEGAKFFDKKGKAVTISPPLEGCLFFPINVTLDDLGPVALQLETLKAAGVLRSEEFLWTVQLNDLRVILDIIESPTLFLQYWRRRIAAYSVPRFGPCEELDCLMFFLEYGLFFEGDTADENENLLVNLTDPLDAYFRAAEMGQVPVKPRMNLHAAMRDLLEKVEGCHEPGFTVLGLLLFGLSGLQQKTVSKMIEDLIAKNQGDSKVHQFTYLLRDFDTAFNLVCLSPNDNGGRKKMLQYSFIKKYETKLTNWHTVIVENDGGKMGAVWTHTFCKKWEHDSQMEKLVQMLRDARAQKASKMSRNDFCLCGSGKRVKDCRDKGLC